VPLQDRFEPRFEVPRRIRRHQESLNKGISGVRMATNLNQQGRDCSSWTLRTQKPHSVPAMEKRVSIGSERLPVMLRQFPRTMKRQMLTVVYLCCVDLEFCPCALVFSECHVWCRLQLAIALPFTSPLI
jgi:hypothetical protein